MAHWAPDRIMRSHPSRRALSGEAWQQDTLQSQGNIKGLCN